MWETVPFFFYWKHALINMQSCNRSLNEKDDFGAKINNTQQYLIFIVGRPKSQPRCPAHVYKA